MKNNILIIAGEPSGDMHAGKLLKELNEQIPGVSFWGIGGDRMEQQGVELVEHIKSFSIVGVWEAVRNISKIHAQYKHITREIQERKPSLAILVDYPGFNLRVASFLHRQKIPVIYYIIPQVWAWGRGRTELLKKHVDKALVLFEFEERLLKESGINCEFVGHPLMDTELVPEPYSEKERLVIALLPGSRKIEIKNMLPVMLDAAENIYKELPGSSFTIAENSNIDKNFYDAALKKHAELPVTRILDDTPSALVKSNFAIVTSGTATLEAAILEKPMIISYRASRLTAWIFFTFVRIPFLGLVNIIAGKQVAPELLQKNATAEKMSNKAIEIMSSYFRMENMREELRKVKYSLGEKGASRRTADAIVKFIKEKQCLPV